MMFFVLTIFRGQGYWTKSISLEGGRYFLQIQIPRYGPGWGGGRVFTLTGAFKSKPLLPISNSSVRCKGKGT